MNRFFDIKKLGGKYQSMLEQVDTGRKVSCFGMSFPERILAAAGLCGKVLFVASDIVSARRAHEMFEQIFGERAVFFPSAGDNLIYKRAETLSEKTTRMNALVALVSGKAKVVVASPESLLALCPKPQDLKNSIKTLKVAQDYNFSELEKSLVSMGYKKEALVAVAGQFAVRGDILDVFPSGSEKPYRIEFFDTTIEKISEFVPATQKTKTECESVDIWPCTNLVFGETAKRELANKLDAELSKSKEGFAQIVETLQQKVLENDFDFSMDFCFPLVEEYMGSIFSYFDKSDAVVIDECKMVFDAISGASSELVARKNELMQEGNAFCESNKGFLLKDGILQEVSKRHNLAFLKVTNSNQFFKTDEVFSFTTSPIVRFTHNYNEFAKAVSTWLDLDYRVFVCAANRDSAKQIAKMLEKRDIYIDIKNNATLADGASAILPFEFSSGFILPTENVVVVGTYDVLPRKSKEQNLAKHRDAVFSVPKVGDYVVHEIHGIGICEGVTKLTGRFGTKDFVVVRYRGDDKLYVPIDQMDLLDRYSGGDTPKHLSKIGGTEFAGIKEKVKNSIRQMAFDLLALYASRESKDGFVFPEDDFLQLEFENAFPYTETEDQLASIEEIKKDMQSKKVMDRLLCGDVGFGKTEVAFRAAFKAVLASKQVAFLAPTTILSEQHFQTAKKRFANFGVHLAVLNRFRTTAEKNQILKDLKAGKIDIIFGTHRLLSKDVEFKDLGLIVLDEEQKFGVEDKEKLKLLKNNVDVLTLSATPIPRTLHMSLTGIRDVSIISSPPSERLPIQTYVTESTQSTIRDAIEKELARGGQVFYVYNRVETIYEEAAKLREICPNAKIVVGHGQLASSELESVVYEFASGRADVLVCTTIIENGIDISNANTLIVQNADMFGLSSLYQIRGRVGRGNRMAYAYFLFAPQKMLSEEAYKRLEAISEFTEFGSGFKIAMRDLEIRGSGNVLGAEQHGQMQKVGYDLYCKMLAEEVAKLKQEEIEEQKEVAMRIDVDAFIADTYIEDSESRMTAYKNISLIKTEEDKQKLEDELKSTFGQLPKETKNILEIAYLKAMAKKLKISEVWSQSGEVKFVFESGSREIVSETMANAVFKFREIASIDLGVVPCIKLRCGTKQAEERLALAKEFLICALSVKK